MEYVAFGRTGLKVSRLAVGTGTHGWAHHSEQTALGLDGLARLLRFAYDHGVNFWDAADEYGSHAHVARAMQGLPPDAVVVATKTTARTEKDMVRDLERFSKELNREVLDIVLLHSMTGADWPKSHAGAMAALARAKEAGRVRAVGISCHSCEALATAAETAWVDVVLARINRAGIEMDSEPDRVTPLLDRLYSAGKAVYGMKVLGCGKLADDCRAAIQYVLQLGTVHAMTIGISKSEHLLSNIRLVEELAPEHPVRPQP